MSTSPYRRFWSRRSRMRSELRVIDRGGGDHLEVQVTAPSLNGLSRIDQHKRVYAALAAPLADGSIHELRIKTRGTAET